MKARRPFVPRRARSAPPEPARPLLRSQGQCAARVHGRGWTDTRTHARASIFFLFKIRFPKPSLHVATIKALESTRVGGTNCDRNVNTCAALPNTVRCCRCERRCRHRWLAAACGRPPATTVLLSPPLWWCPAGFLSATPFNLSAS